MASHPAIDSHMMLTGTHKEAGVDLRDELWCEVTSLSYDFRKRAGKLNIEDGNCCDMEGCLALFKRVDPNVERVETVAGDVPDTTYVLLDGQWAAITPEGELIIGTYNA